ncbi:multidrug resistance efflux transporter family protein [Brevibacillus laterosporus]|uniref:multidrug resistance efflux transporter family protein n=1 Tax=Brevibacillus laterosporus TaxID=1465 RepID=UPI0034532D35
MPVVVASFAYPLGNRKMMQICGERVDTYQRVLGMTICSMPFWMLLSVTALGVDGTPSQSQVFSNLSRCYFLRNMCNCVIFQSYGNGERQHASPSGCRSNTIDGNLICYSQGEVVWLSASLPTPVASAGLMLIMLGMVLHSLVSVRKEKETTLLMYQIE